MPLQGVDGALRLLKKKWKNPDELAAELYAMFKTPAPAPTAEERPAPSEPGPPALRVAPGSAPSSVTIASRIERRPDVQSVDLTIRRARATAGQDEARQVRAALEPPPPRPVAAGPPAQDPPVVRLDSGQPAPLPSADSGPGRATAARPPDAPARRPNVSGPTYETRARGAEPDQKSAIVGPLAAIPDPFQPTHQRPPTTQYLFDSGGGGGVFGKVVSGDGATYQVDLFEDGISKPSTRTVEVRIFVLDSTETLDVGYPLQVLPDGDNFAAQPPIWAGTS